MSVYTHAPKRPACHQEGEGGVREGANTPLRNPTWSVGVAREKIEADPWPGGLRTQSVACPSLAASDSPHTTWLRLLGQSFLVQRLAEERLAALLWTALGVLVQGCANALVSRLRRRRHHHRCCDPTGLAGGEGQSRHLASWTTQSRPPSSPPDEEEHRLLDDPKRSSRRLATTGVPLLQRPEPPLPLLPFASALPLAAGACAPRSASASARERRGPFPHGQ
jgi:hypothetical protein